MKVIIHEDGVEFIPESDFERQALKKLAGKSGGKRELIVEWADSWEQTGNLTIKNPPFDWGT